jgi:hypothetical protein
VVTMVGLLLSLMGALNPFFIMSMFLPISRPLDTPFLKNILRVFSQ